jgi:uncharacterized RDD family membrane protein YckC
VIKICSQCGAVLAAGARVCQFCVSSFSVGYSAIEEASEISTLGIPAQNDEIRTLGIGKSGLSSSSPETIQEPAWRGELAQRLKAYRTRRRKLPTNDGQSHFSFEESPGANDPEASIAIEDRPAAREEAFSFTLAIGRSAKPKAGQELPMEIDVSSPPDMNGQRQIEPIPTENDSQAKLYPVASIDDRRLAAVIDFFCLLFAYGGFLGLFGSLGGHFTLSKLSAAVCVTTFATVYLQYFALFTIFGGTTPGMMMRGLQVVSFCGEPPTPRQMLLRSVGYLLSAGTFFLGFLWAIWDSDELTWHDRLSRTYLSVEPALPDLEVSDAARSR